MIIATKYRTIVLGLSLAILFGGCSLVSERDGAPSMPHLDPNKIADAVPRVESKSRYGNPPSYVVMGKRYCVSSTSKGYVKRGIASWYGTKFHGRRTSSGEVYDMYAMTAAHKSLPLPTYVQVINLRNKRRTVVRVNDRGPFYGKRIIDLSYAAAVKLGMARLGTALVEVRAIDPATWKKPKKKTRKAALGKIQPKIKPKAKKPPPVAAAPAPAPSSSVKKHLSTEKLYLQVGAFSNRQAAERLKTEIHTTIDTAVRITTTGDKSQTLHRVQVGPLDNLAQANTLSAPLADLGLHNLQVLSESP